MGQTMITLRCLSPVRHLIGGTGLAQSVCAQVMSQRGQGKRKGGCLPQTKGTLRECGPNVVVTTYSSLVSNQLGKLDQLCLIFSLKSHLLKWPFSEMHTKVLTLVRQGIHLKTLPSTLANSSPMFQARLSFCIHVMSLVLDCRLFGDGTVFWFTQ